MAHEKGKITCIHITGKRIYLLEGRIKDDFLLVTHTTVVGKASAFFSNDRLVFMSDMVNAIASAMEVNSFTAKQVFIVYDNEKELSVELNMNNDRQTVSPERVGLLGIATMDMTQLSKTIKERRAAKKARAKDNSGTISHKKMWGAYITESDSGEMTTSIRADRDLIEYMVAEFQERGYKVLSIEPLETSLFYLRKFVPFTYDALHKLVVYATNTHEVKYYTFTKDMPSSYQRKPLLMQNDTPDDVVDFWANEIEEVIRGNGLRNPNVMLAGSAFRSVDTYVDLCNTLRDRGIGIIDTYGLWNDISQPMNRMHVVTPSADQGIDVALSAQWGGCIASLMRVLDPKPENLVQGMHLMMTKQSKRNLSALIKTTATAAAIYALIGCGVSAYEVHIATGEAKRAQETTSLQLSNAQQQRDAAKEKLHTLETIDTRYNEIFRFAYSHVDDNLNIASIDTEDMLPAKSTSVSHYVGSGAGYAQASELNVDASIAKAKEEEELVTIPLVQTIVIRGYSRTSSGPISFYESLAGAGLGAVNIVGIEQVTLPSEETLFAFEMTVGAD